MHRPPMLQRRLLCTQISKTTSANHQPRHPCRRRQWNVKQVTKSNFTEALEEIKNHISDSDFVAVSMQRTGSSSAPWHRVQPFDTAETAYFKAKYAAERFQLLQFAVCPFSIRNSKVIVNPYNFHLFPRDELKVGMPSYSFSCQSSYLTSMAREGFDFNACISDGISFLSKAQESAAKIRIGNQASSNYLMLSSSSRSVADAIFMKRMNSRVGIWIDSFKESNMKTEDVLISSLRKLMAGSEMYGSRPSLSIDVCSERQVQLVLEMLKGRSDNLVPLIIPTKGGQTHIVKVVLATSKEDKDILEKELQNKEEEQNKHLPGFREVIDLISTSQKPVVAHNSLNDFSFIHSKFLSPLPPTLSEFRSSLSSVFPYVLDINHLMKEIVPLRKMTNLPPAISQLERRFFAPMDMEIPQKANAEEGKNHGYNVLRISELFAKLYSAMKTTRETIKRPKGVMPSALEGYANIFNPCSSSTSQDHIEGDVSIWAHSTRKVSSKDLVFLWGFSWGISAGMLKGMLHGSHKVFFKEESFDVRLVDRSCAVVVFWNTGLAETFLQAVDSGGFSCESLRDMISEGLRAADYGIYLRACKSGLWDADLSNSLDNAVAELDNILDAQSEESAEIYWDNDLKINLNDL